MVLLQKNKALIKLNSLYSLRVILCEVFPVSPSQPSPIRPLWLYVPCRLGLALILPLQIAILNRLLERLASRSPVKYVLLAYIVLSLLALLLAYGQTWGRQVLVENRRLWDKTRYLAQLRRIPYACFELAEFQDQRQRCLQAQEEVEELWPLMVDLLALILGLSATLALYVWVSPWLLLFFFPAFGLQIYLDQRAMRIMNTMFEGQSPEERRMQAYEQSLSDRSALLFLRAVRGLDLLVGALDAVSRSLFQHRLRTSIRAQRYGIAARMLFLLICLAYLGFSLLGLRSGTLTGATFAALLIALPSLFAQSEQLSYQLGAYVRKRGLLPYLTALHTYEEESVEQNSVTAAQALSPQSQETWIELRDVSFRYPGTEVWVLRDVNLTLARSQHVALVGENGCGKSTLFKLLLGLYRPQEGQIYYGGRPLSELSAEERRSQLQVVFQDIEHFDLSPLELTALSAGRPLEEGQVLEALQNLGLEALAQEPDRPLGKLKTEAHDLSEGQWQRLALARSIAEPGAYLLMDEALSAQDPLVEQALYEELLSQREAAGQGCLLISHRLGSARRAQRILYMERGRIVEEGTHAELLALQGAYARLFASQAQWYQEVSL